MRIQTYGEIRDIVERATDTQDSTFCTADELVQYCNEAIDEAEANIHTIYEDYFLTPGNIVLTSGTSEYAMPSDIYANKIRGLIYRNGTDIYPVKRVRATSQFLNIELAAQFGSADDYRYYIINTAFTDTTDSASGGYRLVLVPQSRETSSTNLRIYYLRNAIRVPLVSEGTQAASDATLVDIPEFYTFVVAFMKERVLMKGKDPQHAEAVLELEKQRKIMIETLTEMVPDTDNELEADLSHYEEHA